MTKTGSLVLGVVVAVLFSIWPMRLANAICCLGVTLGGAIAAYGVGRAQQRVDSTQALRRGALAGVLTAIVLLIGNLLIHTFGLMLAGANVYLDAIPGYVYDTLLGLWAGLLDVASGDTVPLTAGDLGLWSRFFINLFNNALFGAFGGVIASTFFRDAPAAEPN